jgi:hypothetical protein
LVWSVFPWHCLSINLKFTVIVSRRTKNIFHFVIIIIIIITAVGLTPGGSSTAHIYKQTVHRIHRTAHT